jgi:hypothetical protein
MATLQVTAVVQLNGSEQQYCLGSSSTAWGAAVLPGEQQYCLGSRIAEWVLSLQQYYLGSSIALAAAYIMMAW